jgi:transposase
MTEYDADTDKDKAYRDPEVLRKLYHGQFLTLSEVADELDTTAHTVRRWMQKHDIDRRDRSERKVAHPKLADESWMREKYHGEGMSITDLSEHLGVSRMPISRALDRYDIEAHDNGYRSGKLHPGFRIHEQGYIEAYSKYQTDDGEWKQDHLRVHRLVAVSQHGFDAVCDSVIHHRNGIPWDNRPDNLEVMDKRNHVKHHFKERGGLQPWQG